MSKLLLALLLLISAPVAHAASTSAKLVPASSQYFSVTMSTPTGGQTACAWVKFKTLPASGNEYTIIAKHDGGGTTNGRSFSFSLINSAGDYQLFWRNASDGTSANQTTAFAEWTPTISTWYYLCTTYQSSNGIVGFEVGDGTSLVSKGFFTGLKTSIFNGSIPLSIGARSDPGAFLDGSIAQVVLYNTNIATSTRLANMCSAPSATSLLGYWPLDNTLADASGNSHTLTNNNAATFTADVPPCIASPTPAFFGLLSFFGWF